mmetsp:Transcript_16133/g.29013  ORF Transcript_16133/g.29013 Transcript_16133/m.29013 type:complete len:279 (-) Transcript_16133:99-935(-)|eukprot:CAMPEP_0197526236 /NCGR_PEP_ID=MMETSP1318-20131121/16914_1 /TAXON_ID=552666 /ORGANISM="Partenskyella glossopodia, Strain RCC365" /LENGTH=278 /DNA_ID=CAMNT_0043080309 /DNA_START=49 /DNA_END=885 /DNA_ORIENTATION=+
MNVKSGYLEKQSPKFPFPWQKRFFEVQQKPKPLLVYYHKPGEVKPKGTIAADKIANVVFDVRKGKRARIIVSLSTSTRKYYLRASTAENSQAWFTTIRSLMDISDKGNLAEENAPGPPKRVEESKETKKAMNLIHKNLISCLREASEILAHKPAFQKFALHMELHSYFELGSFAPIFGNYFRAVLAFRNPNFEVRLKLEDVSSVDLEKLKFDGFLDEASRTACLPNLRAQKMESMLSGAAQKSIQKLKRYLEEARKVEDTDVVKGLSDIIEMLQCLTD